MAKDTTKSSTNDDQPRDEDGRFIKDAPATKAKPAAGQKSAPKKASGGRGK